MNEKSIVVLHGLHQTIKLIEPMLAETLPDVRVFHMVDQFLSWQPDYVGEFTAENSHRLYLLLKAAELTGADAILMVTSTPCLYADPFKSAISIPVIGILDAVVARVAMMDVGKVGLFSTAPASSDTTLELLRRYGAKMEIEQIICREAIEALRLGNQQLHDSLVIENAAHLRDFELIVLTQLSSNPLAQAFGEACGCPILLPSELCMEDLAKRFK